VSYYIVCAAKFYVEAVRLINLSSFVLYQLEATTQIEFIFVIYFVLIETLKPPKILNCPIQVLSLNTALNNDEAKLSEDATAIQAYDNEGKKLKVSSISCYKRVKIFI
jgi:hypothetical protein